MIAVGREPALGMLRRFVEAAGWQGEDRRLLNAAPHLSPRLKLQDFITTLENFGAGCRVRKQSEHDLRPEDCPCLFCDEEGILLILERRGELSLIMEPGRPPRLRPVMRNIGEMISIAAPDKAQGPQRPESIRSLFTRPGGKLAGLVSVSLLVNFLALMVPAIIMVVLDGGISTVLIENDFLILSAITCALLAEAGLWIIRARLIAGFGAVVERSIGLALLQKVMDQPLRDVARPGVSEGLARFRRIDALREGFAGPLFMALLDLPFSLLFLAGLGLLAPQAALPVLAVIIIGGILASLSTPFLRRLNARSENSRSRLEALLFEMAECQRDIQRLGAADLWAGRADQLALEAAQDAQRVKTASAIQGATGWFFLLLSLVGVFMALAEPARMGETGFGTMVLAMALAWRSLRPLQFLFANAAQILSLRQMLSDVDGMLAAPGETSAEAAHPEIRGGVTMNNASCRLDVSAQPVVRNASLTIAPGELVMMCGESDSGHAALLGMIPRLHEACEGSVLIDGMDQREISVDTLRAAISHELEMADFLYGTIRQNFLMANPLLTDAEMRHWLERLGLLEEISNLPEGLDTRLNDEVLAGFSRATAKGLSLARCLMRPAAIFLFNEPCIGLDDSREHAFLSVIKSFQGEKTVIMTTNRPSHFDLADRLVLMDRGRIVVNEPTATAREKIAALQSVISG